jgi:predicted MFS family arabinose efflux permease
MDTIDRLEARPHLLISAGKSITARRASWVLCAMIPLIVLSQFFRSSNGVIAPDLMADLGLTAEDIGVLSSSFFFVFALLQIPLGILLDRFGARHVLSALMLLAITGSLVFAGAADLSGLIAGRLLIGTGCAGLMVGSLVILARWYSPAHFAGALATLFASANAGSLAATLPLAAAAAAWGWRSTFIGLSVISAMLAAVFFLTVRDAAPGHPFHRRAPETLLDVTKGVIKIIRMRDLCLMFPMVAVGYASFISIVGLWGGPYLHEVYGLGSVARGNVLSLMALSMMVGTLAYGRIDRWIGSRRTLTTLGASASALLLVLLALQPAGPLWQTTALLCLFGFAGAYSLVVMAHGLALVPDELAGRGATALNTALMGGAAIIQAVTGAVVESFPHRIGEDATAAYAMLYAILAGLTLAALLVYRRVRDIDGSAPKPAAFTVPNPSENDLRGASAGA